MLLRLTVAASRIFVIDAENAGLVAVKCQWLAVLFKIAARGFKVGERGLGADEVKLHQAHVNQQHAGQASFLKPAVIAAVDLYQFADAGAAVTGLLHFWCTMPARDPEARLHHQLAHGLFRQHHAVQLGQLLAGKRRAKISVALTDDLNRMFS